MLGRLNVRWDFGDYRDVSGIKLSFLVRTSEVSSYGTLARGFSEIEKDFSLNENVLIFLEDLQARKMWHRRRLRRSHQRSEICQRIHKPHVID